MATRGGSSARSLATARSASGASHWPRSSRSPSSSAPRAHGRGSAARRSRGGAATTNAATEAQAAAGPAGRRPHHPPAHPRRRPLRRAAGRGPGHPRIGIARRGGPAPRRRWRPSTSADRPVLPAMELIATVVPASPGDDGTLPRRQSSALIGRYLAAARRAQALLILDIQPGRSPTSCARSRSRPLAARAGRRDRARPRVAYAGRRSPGPVIGATDADVVDRVSAWVSRLVRRTKLPHELLIVHQFTTTKMIRQRPHARDLPRRRT